MLIKFTKVRIRIFSFLFFIASLNAKGDGKRAFKNAVALPVSNYNPCRYYFPDSDLFDCKNNFAGAKNTKDCLRKQIADYSEEVSKLSKAVPAVMKTIQNITFTDKKIEVGDEAYPV